MLNSQKLLQNIVRVIPLLALTLVPTKSHADALTYAHTNDEGELVRDLYPETYSELGAAAFSDALFIIPLADVAPFSSPIAKLVGGLTGRMIGTMMIPRQDSTSLYEWQGIQAVAEHQGKGRKSAHTY